jgi:predicted Zn-dependent protease
VILASDVCLRGGYLCADLPSRGEIRIARWNEDTDRIHIRVPRPPALDRGTARALQEAVARGLRAWHGRPFPIRVDLSDRPGPEDFAVTWSSALGERRLGRASTRWTLENGRADLEVTELVLVTRDPWRPERTIRPSQIELAAAHEMGHALGLPHSDEPRDVMYPENTATRLTARDYITMSSLYALENGAVVRSVHR